MSEHDFLAAMAAHSAARVVQARATLPLEALAERVQASAPSPPLVLSAEGFDLIMEVKLASPAAGVLAGHGLEPARQALDYAAAGAALVSVLTEPSRFQGTLGHLKDVARALAVPGVPAMRKDFLVDAYQLYEARAHGAGGVLLICRMLGDARLDELLALAGELSLFVLLETFDAPDIERARRAAQYWRGRATDLLIGVNSRDLTSLKVIPHRLEELVALLPSAHPRVAESGLGSAADAARLAAAGYDAALVGTALMAAGDPVTLGAQMIAAGRAARAVRR